MAEAALLVHKLNAKHELPTVTLHGLILGRRREYLPEILREQELNYDSHLSVT